MSKTVTQSRNAAAGAGSACHRAKRPWFVTGVAVACSICAITLAVGVSRAAFPHDNGQVDSGLWAPADVIARGDNPFTRRAAFTPPYIVGSYGPFYYGILAAAVRPFGDQLWFGRSLAVVALLADALLIGLIVHRLAPFRRRLMSVLAMGLFLGQLPAQSFAGLERPDTLALSFALGAAWLVLAPRSEPPGVGRAAVAGLLLGLCVLTRQTILLPAVFLFIGLLLQRRRRAAFVLLGCWALIVAAGVALVTMSGGGSWSALTLEARVPLSRHLGFVGTRTFIVSAAAAATGLLMCVAAVFSRRSALGNEQAGGAGSTMNRLTSSLPLLYLAFAAVEAAVTGAKPGANINYWFEVSALMSVLTPLYLDRALSGSLVAARRGPRLTLCCLTAAALAGALATSIREVHGEVLRWRGVAYLDRLVQQLDRVDPPGRPVLTVYPELAVAAKRPYYFNQTSLYAESPTLSPILRRVLASHVFEVVIDASAPPGYQRACGLPRPPVGLYPVYLYVRAGTRGAGTCGRQ